jgi:hypothetical protein
MLGQNSARDDPLEMAACHVSMVKSRCGFLGFRFGVQRGSTIDLGVGKLGAEQQNVREHPDAQRQFVEIVDAWIDSRRSKAPM